MIYNKKDYTLKALEIAMRYNLTINDIPKKYRTGIDKDGKSNKICYKDVKRIANKLDIDIEKCMEIDHKIVEEDEKNKIGDKNKRKSFWDSSDYEESESEYTKPVKKIKTCKEKSLKKSCWDSSDSESDSDLETIYNSSDTEED